MNTRIMRSCMVGLLSCQWDELSHFNWLIGYWNDL